MIRHQEITQLNGFGQGNFPGKYFFSSGFKRTDEGTTAAWRIASAGSNGFSSLQQWFADLNGQVWSTGETGNLYAEGTLTRTVEAGKGLIVDQKNRLLYARSQYLGSLDGITYNDTFKDFGSSVNPFRPL